ncbi:MAG: hypothetical protein PHU98_06120 [Mariniphaga sp.]|nr:hypothetical protein [Mariniphaga sp.]
MSTTAGAINETLLQNLRRRADALMFDEMIKLQFQPKIDSISAIQRLMTAQLGELKQKDKTLTIELEWMNACGITTQACTPCTVGGTEISTNTETYTIGQCREVAFTIPRYKFLTNDFGWEEATAKARLKADVELSEYVNQYFVAWLASIGGTNQWTGDATTATVTATETQIALANYNANIVAYLTKVATFNDFRNPLMISGDLLYNAYVNAQFQAGNFPYADQVKRFGAMDWMWDLWNFNALGLNAYQMMVNQGAIAFVSKSLYGPTPIVIGDTMMGWSENSRFVPGMILEYKMKQVCENDLPTDQYSVTIRFDFFQNPEGCTANKNGVLLFHQV